ncbi:AAA family ATPase [Pseudothermotoga thermarum]|uniref:DNA repair protein RecN n=1 Tax=Pseudothermotoga thermarum DSM 5069 TaxID=688269 RepID=F7YXK6_9THEM|nr:AAA family ATPase [Pseudothermotoga thermarum]AEH50647.1 SMC domain protein [Pseudothermotoga thermarum DSM 5069]
MLVSFSGRKLLFFEQFNVNFSDKLNVLTGETGAGKSVLIRALQALFGKKVDLPASEGCELEALFVVPEEQMEKVKDFGIESEEIVVSLTVGKRWIYRLNGKLVPQNFVEQLFEDLVQFHQQNSQTGILKKQNQLLLLDRFHDEEELVKEYSSVYKSIKDFEKFLNQHDEQKLLEKLEELKVKIHLIEKVNPSIVEEASLRERYDRLMKQKEVVELLNEIVEIVEDDKEFGFQRLLKILQKIERSKLPVPSELVNLLDDVVQKSFEIARVSRKILDEFELEDVEKLEERIWLYNELKRKFGPTVEDVLENYKRLLNEYQSIEENLNKLKTAKEQLQKLKTKALQIAERLHEKRVEAARQLESIVQNHMKDLALNYGFVISVEKQSQLGPHGLDDVEMKLKSHDGELLGLKNVLSGGELSRLMLSIELACASKSFTDVLVFDEVDAGIGGLTGNVLGMKLKQVSKNYQTIVVTHLPQIARLADTHILVERLAQDKMRLKVLSEDERNQEIIRMIGGLEVLQGKDRPS